jgi:hypothetical protein
MPALCVLLFYLVLGHTHEEIRIVAGLAYLASMNLHRMVPSMCQKGGSFCPQKNALCPVVGQRKAPCKNRSELEHRCRLLFCSPKKAYK